MTRPTNAAFVGAVFRARPEGEAAWVAGFPGDPACGRWGGLPVLGDLPGIITPTNNNYVCVSTFRPDKDGTWRGQEADRHAHS